MHGLSASSPDPSPSGVHAISFDDRAASAWAALVQGVSVITRTSISDACRVYVVERRRGLHSEPFSRRERIVAERLGQGLSRKEIGHLLGISTTSVARAVDLAAQKIGAESGMDVVVLAAAFGPARRAGRAYVIDGAPDCEILHAPLGESAMWHRFSIAEREVIALALSGLSSGSIAQRRGDRSERTIANQLAHVFRKASVSGRAELAARLLTG